MLCTLVSLKTVDGVTVITGECNGFTKDFKVDRTCQVFVNGKMAKLSDLKAGDKLEIDGQPAVIVKAQRSK